MRAAFLHAWAPLSGFSTPVTNAGCVFKSREINARNTAPVNENTEQNLAHPTEVTILVRQDAQGLGYELMERFGDDGLRRTRRPSRRFLLEPINEVYEEESEEEEEEVLVEEVVEDDVEEASVEELSSSSSSSEEEQAESVSDDGSDVCERDGSLVGAEHPELWFFAALVADRAQKKTGVRVVETVLFRDGQPWCWVFVDKKQRLRRRHRRRLEWPVICRSLLGKGLRHKNQPVAVLRWRTAGKVVSTLLAWRDVANLNTQIPEPCGPALTSWRQFVALQPRVAPVAWKSSGVFVHRVDVDGSHHGGLLAAGVTREHMAWPGEAPRSKNDVDRLPSAQLVRDDDLHSRIQKVAALAVRRARAGAGSRIGPGHYLAPGLRLRGLVAEIVVDARNNTPCLTFVHDLHLADTAPVVVAIKDAAVLEPETTTTTTTSSSSSRGSVTKAAPPHRPWCRRRPAHLAQYSRAHRVRLATLAAIMC